MWFASECSRNNARRRGFSKIEFGVGVGIVGTLIALLIPALQKTREAERRNGCLNNLRQIGLGLHNFENAFNQLPPLYGGVASEKDQASTKFPAIWGSTHVFLVPFMEASDLWNEMATGEPSNCLPSMLGDKNVPYFCCPSDPGIRDSATAGGTSYATNAQVFAPLQNETVQGTGSMYAAPHPNYCDRGARLSELRNGTSNTIGFTHSYSLCGSSTTGTSWAYTGGLNMPPSITPSTQPWSRATLIGQKGMLAPGDKVFQNQPSPYGQPFDGATSSGCDPSLPATPHANAMMVLLMDASVRSVTTSIDYKVWNEGCLPNNDSRPAHGSWEGQP